MKKEFNFILYNKEFYPEPAVIKFDYELYKDNSLDEKVLNLKIISALISSNIDLEEFLEKPLYQLLEEKLKEIKEIPELKNVTAKIEFDAHEAKKGIPALVLNDAAHDIQFGYIEPNSEVILSAEDLKIGNNQNFNFLLRTAQPLVLLDEKLDNLIIVIDNENIVKEINMDDINILIKYAMQSEHIDNTYFVNLGDVEIIIDLTLNDKIDNLTVNEILNETMLRKNSNIIHLNKSSNNENYKMTENVYNILNVLSDKLKNDNINKCILEKIKESPSVSKKERKSFKKK